MIRLDRNGKPYSCKTSRRRGEATAAVLKVASKGRPFTRLDVSWNQNLLASWMCQLVKLGYLRVVKPGTRGRNGRHTVYIKASSATPTRKEEAA